MKTKLILITVLISAFCLLHAQGPQIPNGSFASWDTIVMAPADTLYDTVNTTIDTVITPADLFFTPAGWATIDDVIGDSLGFSYIDTVDVAPGSVASLELVTDTLTGQSDEGVIVSVASLGTGVFTGSGINFSGIPFIFRPDTLFFDYQYTSPATDTAGVFLNLVNSDTMGIIGGDTGAQINLPASSGWTTYSIVLTQYYISDSVPDSLYLQFYSSIAQNPVIGSALHITNVRFGYNTLNENVTVVGPTTFCAGDSIILSAPTNAAYSYYQWYMGDETTPVGITNSSYFTVYQSGAYFVVIDSMGALAVSALVNVTVNTPAPGTLVAVLGADTNSFCFPSGAVNLYATPAGGTFIGTGITDSTFTPYQTGTFVLSYAYTDTATGCPAVATDAVSVSVCTGITDIAAGINLDVFPNPTANILNIISDEDLTGFNAQIFDVVGRRVSSQVIEGFGNTVNVSALSNGLYIIKVMDAQNAIVSQNKFEVIR